MTPKALQLVMVLNLKWNEVPSSIGIHWWRSSLFSKLVSVETTFGPQTIHCGIEILCPHTRSYMQLSAMIPSTYRQPCSTSIFYLSLHWAALVRPLKFSEMKHGHCSLYKQDATELYMGVAVRVLCRPGTVSFKYMR